MKESVLIKGNKHGLTIILSQDSEFEIIKEDLKKKLLDGKNFFGNAKVSLTLKGRDLNEEEQNEIIQLITEYSDLQIICIVDEHFDNSKNNIKADTSDQEAVFYKGTLRSGQVLNVENSIIIIGDVNPGAKVISKGNIIVLGSLKGNVHAGSEGDKRAFVVALYMDPLQVIIGDVIGRAPDKEQAENPEEPKIAFVEGSSIYIESLNKNSIKEVANA